MATAGASVIVVDPPTIAILLPTYTQFPQFTVLELKFQLKLCTAIT